MIFVDSVVLMFRNGVIGRRLGNEYPQQEMHAPTDWTETSVGTAVTLYFLVASRSST